MYSQTKKLYENKTFNVSYMPTLEKVSAETEKEKNNCDVVT
jgi:DNA-dependent RNA polymerase auxiliary subunit epsilon